VSDLRARLTHRSRAAQRDLRNLILGRRRSPKTVREDVAAMYLRGSGIEIGALNFPLRVPRGVRVRYVDYLPAETLREHHAHLLAAGRHLTLPDVVDDGERLAGFGDGELDFVIANHFIEHAEDPIATLGAHLRVLRPGGVLYMAVPDKRRSFDVDRPVTSLEHLVTDHVEGPQTSRTAHYEEWARLVDRVADDEVARHAADLATRRFSIHFHVWTPRAYAEMLTYCQDAGFPLELELLQRNEHEFLTVLRKTSGVAPQLCGRPV
jgi:SAM-dependent methyltransferase